MVALGPSLFTIIAVLGLTSGERYTRVVRAEVLALREKDFVEAARAMGASPLRTILCPRPRFRERGVVAGDLPGLAILLTVLAINLVGDRLRDALDPRVG